jgi:hypothetical protein
LAFGLLTLYYKDALLFLDGALISHRFQSTPKAYTCLVEWILHEHRGLATSRSMKNQIVGANLGGIFHIVSSPSRSKTRSQLLLDLSLLSPFVSSRVRPGNGPEMADAHSSSSSSSFVTGHSRAICVVESQPGISCSPSRRYARLRRIGKISLPQKSPARQGVLSMML